MSVDPHNLLASVHPDLVKVILAAATSPIDFQVIYGIRTLAEEQEAVATGHSQTMHSRHLPDPNYTSPDCPGGMAMAVDLAVLVNGQIDWTVGNDPAGGNWGLLSQQILSSAQACGVPVMWGGAIVGAWIDGVTSHFRDWGHYQLDPSTYR